VAWSDLLPEKDSEGQRKAGMPVRIHDDRGQLLALGRFSESRSGRIAIEKVFALELI
jgi:hypothetical protein